MGVFFEGGYFLRKNVKLKTEIQWLQYLFFIPQTIWQIILFMTQIKVKIDKLTYLAQDKVELTILKQSRISKRNKKQVKT